MWEWAKRPDWPGPTIGFDWKNVQEDISYEGEIVFKTLSCKSYYFVEGYKLKNKVVRNTPFEYLWHVLNDRIIPVKDRKTDEYLKYHKMILPFFAASEVI